MLLDSKIVDLLLSKSAELVKKLTIDSPSHVVKVIPLSLVIKYNEISPVADTGFSCIMPRAFYPIQLIAETICWVKYVTMAVAAC